MKPSKFRGSINLTEPFIDENWSHSTYINEVEKIANTIYPDICFSSGQKFNGIGLIGILGEIALSFNGSGDILEVGIGTSSLYLTNLAKRYRRKIYHMDIDKTKFLYGIGTKQHISPESEIFVGKTDDLFKNNKLTSLAFALIDADHHYEQAKRDFWNAEQYLLEGGFIALHDTFPPSEDAVASNMCGDCFKLRQDLEKDKRFDCISFPVPLGFTFVRKKFINRPYYQE